MNVISRHKVVFTSPWRPVSKNGRLQEGFPEDRGGSELPPGHGQENPNAAAGCEDP